MRHRLARLLRAARPTPSMMVAILALVVATAGTSYAAVLITGKDVKNGSLTGADVRKNSVGGSKIKKNSVSSNKLKKESISSGRIKDGGVKAADLAPGLVTQGDVRWALVNAAGQIEAQSGGFSVTAAYPTLPNTAPAGSPDNSLRANGNVYIDAGEPLGNNGIVATIALQNTVDQNGDAVTNGRATGEDANPEFSGEISVSQCGLPGTACAPPGTATATHLVVSPRDSDGTVTTDADRKRFYVVVTGDSSDRTR